MRKWILGVLLLSNVALAAEESTIQQVVKSDRGGFYHTGYLGHNRKTGNLHFQLKPSATELPASYDLRTLGLVSKIKNQGGCGSCWSFAITKATESARLKAGLTEQDLSEQQQVSCDRNAAGCGGGNMDNADYEVGTGLALESDYPYTASNSRCRSPLPTIASKLKSWAYVGGGNRKPTVDELKQAIYQYGTIFVTVAAGGSDWGGSRVHMTGCSNRGTNHMVTLVGWNEQNEFIIGNSWGSDWGESGFAYAKQGCDNLANDSDGAAFVVYEGGPAPVPPHIRLPIEIDLQLGTEVMLGVRAESGVTYHWSNGETGAMIYVKPTTSTTYTLTATNSAGVAESSVNVKVEAAR